MRVAEGPSRNCSEDNSALACLSIVVPAKAEPHTPREKLWREIVVGVFVQLDPVMDPGLRRDDTVFAAPVVRKRGEVGK